MGGFNPVEMLVDPFTPIRKAILGSDPLMDAVTGGDEESTPYPQPEEKSTDMRTDAPEAPKANTSAQLLAQQKENRRKRVLFQSLGRDPLSGPMIENSQQPTQTTNRTALF